jgi:hypothetical protein
VGDFDTDGDLIFRDVDGSSADRPHCAMFSEFPFSVRRVTRATSSTVTAPADIIGSV